MTEEYKTSNVEPITGWRSAYNIEKERADKAEALLLELITHVAEKKSKNMGDFLDWLREFCYNVINTIDLPEPPEDE